MSVYRIADVYNRLCEMTNEGYEYAEISLLNADDEFSECLYFNALEDSNSSVDYEEVESCQLPDDYYYNLKSSRSVKADDYCSEINFTYREVGLIKHAVDNALAYFKELLNDSSQSKDTIKQIQQSSIECRNFQAKLAKFLKHLS